MKKSQGGPARMAGCRRHKMSHLKCQLTYPGTIASCGVKIWMKNLVNKVYQKLYPHDESSCCYRNPAKLARATRRLLDNEILHFVQDDRSPSAF